MKEAYTSPEMEIIAFDCEDVITTSFTGKGTAGDINSSKPDITIDP
ncbi:MAG: hypothetical protein IKI21_10660 [Oscillospiraceae bacterium]|nr:hypothetical protein [Oscillospiraceae bacterium]